VIFAVLLGPPLLAALVAYRARPYRPAAGRAIAWLSLLPVGGGLVLWGQVLRGSAPTALGDLLRADALSALLVLCIGFVAALAAWLGPGGGEDERDAPDQTRRFWILTSLFTFAMLLAVTTNNVGLMWVSIEATTITSAVLISLHRTKASVEASWKYILIGSVGIALAFTGTVLGYFDFVQLAGQTGAALHWTVLVAVAPALHPSVIQLAFVFILIGYGTKAGLAPMHTWLPDAHSEAPVATSAMMSGVLLAVSLYAIVRWEAVVQASVGSAFTDRLLILLGLLSLGIAALSLVVQRNYKRMLAYSSVEHVGLICLGLALGPLGMFAAMLHLLNHAVAKSMLFLLAGRVLVRYGTTDLARVTGLLRTMPITGRLFAAGMLAIVGLPPFGLFISELTLVRAGFAQGRPWLTAAMLALLALAFVALLGHLNRMLYGEPPAGVAVGERGQWPLALLGACVATLVVLGLATPAPVGALLARIVELTGS
jgi:hydrogenase-4 component F